MDVNKLWKEHKKNDSKITELIQHYRDIATKKDFSLRKFWSQAPKASSKSLELAASVVQIALQESTNPTLDVVQPEELNTEDISKNTPVNSYVYRKPAQDYIRQRLSLLNGDLVGLYQRREMNLISAEQEKDLKSKEIEKSKLNVKLKIKLRDQLRQKKHRIKVREKLIELAAQNIKENIVRSKSGRPRLEEDQPLLLQAIIEIAIHGSAAHEKRRSDIYRTVKTLDELIAALKTKGFTLSRSTGYLRLLPSRSNTEEGKRHVNTVPVKLIRAGIAIKPNGFGNRESVGYSGPTYIAIRSGKNKEFGIYLFVSSGKHSSSTANSLCLDFERLLELEEFDSITKFNSQIKPVVIFTVDGGPGENPRYKNVINVAVHHFKKHDLDVLCIALNSPGRSAFNRVERRMAPLSKELAGVILPHDKFGSHLDSQGNTIDHDLEKRNFKFAGETLAQIWTDVVMDKFPTKAEYINPEHSEIDADSLISMDSKWMSTHVCTSQYFTQIVKCHDEKCCKKPRSSYFKIFGDDNRFIPPPVPLTQSSVGIVCSKESTNFATLFMLKSLKMADILPIEKKIFKGNPPDDLFCPSVQDKLSDRICKKCKKYFATIVMLRDHVSQVHKRESVIVPRILPVRIAARRARELLAIMVISETDFDAEWIDEEHIEPNAVSTMSLEENKNETMPLYSMKEHFSSVWE